MPGGPVREKEWRLATCRDSRQRRHPTQDEVVLSAPVMAASRRGWLSDVPTSKAACFCPALSPAGRPQMRGFQKAYPLVRFAPSTPVAQELYKSLCFLPPHLLSTTSSHWCLGKPFRTLERHFEIAPL